MWLIRLDSFYYALFAFTLSFAGYEGEIMRAPFLVFPAVSWRPPEPMACHPEGTDTRVVPARRASRAPHACRRTGSAAEKSTPVAFTVRSWTSWLSPPRSARIRSGSSNPHAACRDLHVPDIRDCVGLWFPRTHGSRKNDDRRPLSRHRDELTASRHDLHMHPEMLFEEVRTSAIVARELVRLASRSRRELPGRGRRDPEQRDRRQIHRYPRRHGCLADSRDHQLALRLAVSWKDACLRP